MTDNLNSLPLPTDGRTDVTDYARKNALGNGVSALFTNLESELIFQINRAEIILGCVAWLTNENIINALAKKQTQIVVQKEDFLRPEMFYLPDWKWKIRGMYDRLHFDITRHELPDFAQELSVCGDPEVAPVRCMGNYNRDKAPVHPRMHHKFVLFCKRDFYPDDDYPGMFGDIKPYAVWTGSFNFTHNAGQSLENALIITIPEIVAAYTREYAHVLALSESLDWEADWVEPEYRIGT